METKHPFEVDVHVGGIGWYITIGDKEVCGAHSEKEASLYAAIMRDAISASAAPDLLEACKTLPALPDDFVQDGSNIDACLAFIEAVETWRVNTQQIIAKATGQAAG